MSSETLIASSAARLTGSCRKTASSGARLSISSSSSSPSSSASAPSAASAAAAAMSGGIISCSRSRSVLGLPSALVPASPLDASRKVSPSVFRPSARRLRCSRETAVSVSTFLHTRRSVASTSTTETSHAPSRKVAMSFCMALACSSSARPCAALLTLYILTIAFSAATLVFILCCFILNRWRTEPGSDDCSACSAFSAYMRPMV